MIDNERLLRGIMSIRDHLDQGRIGDASFICEALLAGSGPQPRDPDPRPPPIREPGDPEEDDTDEDDDDDFGDEDDAA